MNPRTGRTRGFSLLEMVLVVALLALLAGAVVPVASVLARRAKNDAILERLEAVATAVQAYFRDTWEQPKKIVDLAVDSSVAGWNGPYLLRGFVAGGDDSPDIDEDDFGNALVLRALDASTVRLASLGADGAAGGGDDLERIVNLIPLRREETLRRQAILNAAIVAYNRNRTETDPPLAGNVGSAFATLVGAGYLPNDTALLDDGFGDAFVADPPGSDPLVAVKSIHLGGGG